MKKIKTIDVALFIFIFTGIGYYTTFSYNWGYNTYFSLPLHFIDFSILNITKSVSLIVIGMSVFLVWIIFFLDKTDINSVFSKIRKLTQKKLINIILQLICLLVVVALITLLSMERNDKFFIVYVWMIIIITAMYFSLKKYTNAMIVALIVSFLILPYIVGLFNASTQTEFFVLNDEEDYLIITFTDEKIIAAKYENDENTLLAEFRVLPMEILGEDSNNLRLVKIDRPLIKTPDNL